MVALTPAARNRRKLVAILGKAAEDLASLGAGAVALLEASRGKHELSPKALSALARLAAQGRERISQRLAALGCAGLPPAPPPPAEPSLAGAAALSAFIGTYRRCGRRLCLAQQEAREAADGATSDLVFFLLRDLERQLWLLDDGRGGVPFEAVAAPGLLQFC